MSQVFVRDDDVVVFPIEWNFFLGGSLVSRTGGVCQGR